MVCNIGEGVGGGGGEGGVNSRKSFHNCEPS